MFDTNGYGVRAKFSKDIVQILTVRRSQHISCSRRSRRGHVCFGGFRERTPIDSIEMKMDARHADVGPAVGTLQQCSGTCESLKDRRSAAAGGSRETDAAQLIRLT
jgi:hypothetical protein